MYFRMAGAIVLVALGIQSRINAQSKAVFDGFKVVDKNGNISKPGDYRDIFQMIGAYAVIDPKGNELHYSYASPGAIDSYRRNKKFADGTVLVKEVFGTEHAQLTHRQCSLGVQHQSMVCPYQRCKGPISEQPALGRRLGLGTLQERRAR
jgi:hypothetical protein